VAASAGFGTGVARADDAPIHDPLDAMRVTRLDNGLTVLSLEDHSSPVASFQVWVEVGSSDEARYTGIAHLFEHLMFRGSKHLGKEVHSQIVEARGGRVNASTSQDVTRYFEDVPSEHLPLVIALEAERFANLVIDDEALESEREVVISERRWRNEDDPGGRAFEQLMASAFKAHPYHHPVVGWLSDLQQVSVEQCRAFFDVYYAANNLVIAVAGDFDTDQTLARIRDAFGGLRSAAEVPRNPTWEPPQRGERRADVLFDVAGPLLSMAWHAPPSGHADSEALDVLTGVLSDGRASRLYRRMVHAEDAVALGAQGVYWELDDAGLFYAGVEVRPGASIDTAEALFLEEVERIRAEAPSEAEVDRARRSLEVGLIVGQGSAHALAGRMGRDWVTFGRIRPLQERLARIRGVTPADVQRVAKKYLVPEGRTVVRVIAPPPAAAAGTTEGAGS